MKTKKIISITTGLALAMSMALAIPVFAETNGSNQQSDNQAGNYNQPNGGWQAQGQNQVQQGQSRWNGPMMGGPVGTNRGPGMMGSGIFGTVSAVNGNIITVNVRQGFGSTTINYTVNATNATVKKNNATSTVSSIAIGDTIFAQGTVTGTNVVATTILDGAIGRGVGGRGGPDTDGRWASSTPMMNGKSYATSTSPFLGNGQPIVAGKISVINGTTLTITTTSNITYTVDASSSKITNGQNSIALSSVAVGDTVLIQGTVNGTSIIASTIVDQSGPAASVTANMDKGQKRGFFGGIGQFFMHLFGF